LGALFGHRKYIPEAAEFFGFWRIAHPSDIHSSLILFNNLRGGGMLAIVTVLPHLGTARGRGVSEPDILPAMKKAPGGAFAKAALEPPSDRWIRR
jgi:hypothetical protein